MYQQQHNQDELSNLFAQTMTLNPMTPPPELRMQPPPSIPTHHYPVSQIQEAQKPVDQRIVYTSMHYTPTHHVVPVRYAQDTPEATPERQLPLSDEEMIAMLEQNSINPQSLFESQVHLLRHADLEQRLRLLELWRISPPNGDSGPSQGWNSTSVEQEEQMAKLRYEQTMTQQQSGLVPRSGSSMSDEAAMPPTSIPILDRPASAPGTRSSAEPYMTSGYEMLARRDYEQQASQRLQQQQQQQQNYALQEIKQYRQATDPAFMGYADPRFAFTKSDQENLGFVTCIRDDDMEL